MPNLSVFPEMSVVTVRTDDDFLGTVFINMLLEKPLLKSGSALIRAQHVHELTFICVFLRSRKKWQLLDFIMDLDLSCDFYPLSRCAK